MEPPLDPPRAPILKCFTYVSDVADDQGPTAVLRGSHRIPWAPDGIYDLHSAGFKGFAGAAGFAGAPGHGKYNAEAGYCPTSAVSTSV
jgi:hypothetical protein